MLQVCKVSLLFAAALTAAETGVGRWEGAVQIPGRELQVVIDLAQDGGRWIGSAVVPGFDIKGAPLGDIAVKDGEVAFTIKNALGEPKFKGRLSGDTLAGDYTQAGNTAPFELRNVGAPQVELPKQSTVIAKRLEGEWQGDMTYAGNPMHVTLKLANQSSGKASGQFVLKGKREYTLPIDLVMQDDDTLTLELPGVKITYEGRIRQDPAEITGIFAQPGAEATLVLRPATGSNQ